MSYTTLRITFASSKRKESAHRQNVSVRHKRQRHDVRLRSVRR